MTGSTTRSRGISTGGANELALNWAQSQASATPSASISAMAPGFGPMRYTAPWVSDTTYSLPSGPFSMSVTTPKPLPKRISDISAEQTPAPLLATRSSRGADENASPSRAAFGLKW